MATDPRILERALAERARRVAAGICIYCPVDEQAPALPGQKGCAACNDFNAAKARARRGGPPRRRGRPPSLAGPSATRTVSLRLAEADRLDGFIEAARRIPTATREITANMVTRALLVVALDTDAARSHALALVAEWGAGRP